MKLPRVVFLDVDGVLNHPAHWDRQQRDGYGRLVQCDAACVERLMRTVEDADARIVVSSSHRSRFVTVTKDRFRTYGIPPHFVVGVTPALDRLDVDSGLYLGVTRGREIRAWLDANAERQGVERLCIVDDGNDMGDLTPYLVRTDPNVGLTDADCARITAMLKGDQ